LDDVITLTEDELAEGVASRCARRTPAEGAAPLMAAMKLRDQLVGKKVVRDERWEHDAATLARVVAGGGQGLGLRG
jgi:hypothetical protein